MFTSLWAASRPVGSFLRAVCVAGVVLLTGCATHYVDGAVKEIPTSQFVKPAQPKPVQLVFEFQTKGAANARATEQVKPMVVDSLKSSGLFAQVEDKPVSSGALISVNLNNVALTDDAFGKGFMTGLTFGLAGSTVTDGYQCTVSYLAPGAATPIIKTSKHAIHTALGSSGAPQDGQKASSIDDAVRTMVRQVLALALNDLSRDPQFK